MCGRTATATRDGDSEQFRHVFQNKKNACFLPHLHFQVGAGYIIKRGAAGRSPGTTAHAASFRHVLFTVHTQLHKTLARRAVRSTPRPPQRFRVGRSPFRVTFRLYRRAVGSYVEDNQTAKEHCNAYEPATRIPRRNPRLRIGLLGDHYRVVVEDASHVLQTINIPLKV